MTTEDVTVAEKRWGGRGATARRNRIAKACRVWISAEDVAVAEQRVGEDQSPQQGVVAVQLLERCRRSPKQAGWQALPIISKKLFWFAKRASQTPKLYGC
jgi:hypothetical protein